MSEQFDKLKIAETMVIEVTKCSECRFLQADNASRDWCRITQKDLIKTNSIPDFCPLRTSEIIVKLKQNELPKMPDM